MASSSSHTTKRRRVEEEQDARCFRNPYLEDAACKIPGSTEEKEINPKLPVGLKERLLQVLADSLPLVDEAYAPGHLRPQDQTVYTGCTGAALLHLHLATTVYSDSDAIRTTHLETALSLISSAQVDARHITFLSGGAGALAVGAVIHAHLGNATSANACIRVLKEIFTKSRTTFVPRSSELLYGHGGYLFGLLFVNAYLPGTIEEDIIKDVATLILDLGESNREPSDVSPLMYMWHRKYYLGAAHGFSGIMAVLLQVDVKELEPRITALVKPCVDYLLSLCFPSGNLPSSLESSHGDVLVHWCHGAPGFVHLMALAYKVFGEQRYFDAAVKCGEVVWERGLLRKGYSMCHGVAGNTYTFLQLYRMTNKPQYISRAMKFVEWCLSSSERQTDTPDTPFSLFEGLAGTLYMYTDILGKFEHARFPGLEVPVVNCTLTDTNALYP